MELLDLFSEEEREVIARRPEMLTPEERAYRYTLFIRPLRYPFRPGEPVLTDALILASFGVKGAGDQLAKVLNQVYEGTVDFSELGGTWSIARRTMEVILTHLRQTSIGVPGKKAPPFHDLLYRNFDGLSPQAWLGFGVGDVDLITARFIEERAPEEFPVVPQDVVARLPRFGQPTIIVNPPRPEVVRPTIVRESRPPPPAVSPREVAEAVGTKVREALEPLPEQFEAAFVRALARGQAFIPPAPATAAAPAAPAPFIPPVPPPPVGPVTAASEALGGTRQRNLMGETVATAAATLTPVELAAQQLEDKYRPVFLDQVIGSEEAVGELKAAAATDFRKAYGIQGIPGIGKTSAVLAAIRTYLLRVEAATGVRYFNPNYSTESSTFGIDPQILRYENAVSIAQGGGINGLLNRIATFQRTGRLVAQARKFLIVDDFQKLNEEQQKVLLPLTEKYPRSTIFFIANTLELLPALQDRARMLKFSPPTEPALEARLLEIMREEGMAFPDPVAVAQKIVRGLGFAKSFRRATIELATAWDQYRTTGATP